MREKLYIVHGAGPDAVGLVQQVANPIAAVGGNIVDLRQDVMHGLFTLFMVVDLGGCELKAEGFRGLVAEIAEDTGLQLAVEKYHPVPRSADRKSLLIILVGRDRPGVIARISEQLRGYRVNIEFTRMVARAGVFLMELHVDITHVVLPLENLMGVLRQEMAVVGITAQFQVADVFTKKKRIVCFDLGASLIPAQTTAEILRQAGLAPDALAAAYQGAPTRAAVERAAARLERVPVEILRQLAETVAVTPDTVELIETLKIMGYRVVVISTALDFFTEALARCAALNACLGYRAQVDADSQTFTGQLNPHWDPLDRRRLLKGLCDKECVAEDDTTFISDEGLPAGEVLGIGIEFDMKRTLDFVNQRILSRDQLIGVLGSFGAPRF